MEEQPPLLKKIEEKLEKEERILISRQFLEIFFSLIINELIRFKEELKERGVSIEIPFTKKNKKTREVYNLLKKIEENLGRPLLKKEFQIVLNAFNYSNITLNSGTIYDIFRRAGFKIFPTFKFVTLNENTHKTLIKEKKLKKEIMKRENVKIYVLELVNSKGEYYAVIFDNKNKIKRFLKLVKEKGINHVLNNNYYKGKIIKEKGFLDHLKGNKIGYYEIKDFKAELYFKRI